MHHNSLFPPLPDIPPQNIHNLLLDRTDQAEWPDFTLHIDAVTGQSRSFRQFVECVRDGATAMSSDIDSGGLGIRPQSGEIVGVLTENSMVFPSPCTCISIP